MPGMARHLFFYNQDEAAQHKDVIVVEGTTDVWRAGRNAVGLLGHMFSAAQKSTLMLRWARKGGHLIIMLDGDVPLDKLSALQELRSAFGRRLVIVKLPADKDPGDMTTDAIHDLIRTTAWLQGLDPARLTLVGP